MIDQTTIIVVAVQAIVLIAVILFAARRGGDSRDTLDEWTGKLQTRLLQLDDDQQRAAENVVRARIDGLGASTY